MNLYRLQSLNIYTQEYIGDLGMTYYDQYMCLVKVLDSMVQFYGAMVYGI